MLEKSSTIIWLIYDIWKRLKDPGMLLKMLLLTPIRVGSGLKQGGTFHSHEILLPYLRDYFFPAGLNFYVKHTSLESRGGQYYVIFTGS